MSKYVFDAVNTSIQNATHYCSPEGSTLTISIMLD